jgi:hypothetical protein
MFLAIIGGRKAFFLLSTLLLLFFLVTKFTRIIFIRMFQDQKVHFSKLFILRASIHFNESYTNYINEYETSACVAKVFYVFDNKKKAQKNKNQSPLYVSKNTYKAQWQQSTFGVETICTWTSLCRIESHDVAKTYT